MPEDEGPVAKPMLDSLKADLLAQSEVLLQLTKSLTKLTTYRKRDAGGGGGFNARLRVDSRDNRREAGEPQCVPTW